MQTYLRTRRPSAFSACSLQVTHVLSLADEEWAGLQGRIRAELVALFLPKPSNAEGLLVCACGPTPFTNEAVRCGWAIMGVRFLPPHGVT